MVPNGSAAAKWINLVTRGNQKRHNCHVCSVLWNANRTFNTHTLAEKAVVHTRFVKWLYADVESAADGGGGAWSVLPAFTDVRAGLALIVPGSCGLCEHAD